GPETGPVWSAGSTRTPPSGGVEGAGGVDEAGAGPCPSFCAGGPPAGASGHAPTQSPTCAASPVSVPVADPSTAEVILTFPTGVVTRRSTLPVAGSLISRPGRTTVYSVPIRTPPAVPTLMTSSRSEEHTSELQSR